MSRLQGQQLRCVMALVTLAGATTETLPTLTLQPLNYFTLAPPNNPLFPDIPPSTPTSLTDTLPSPPLTEKVSDNIEKENAHEKRKWNRDALENRRKSEENINDSEVLAKENGYEERKWNGDALENRRKNEENINDSDVLAKENGYEERKWIGAEQENRRQDNEENINDSEVLAKENGYENRKQDSKQEDNEEGVEGSTDEGIGDEGSDDEGSGNEGSGDELEKEISPKPEFSSTNRTLRYFEGTLATLDCNVTHPGNQTVSWLRMMGDILELLSWDQHIYTNDRRYSVSGEEGDEWRVWRVVVNGVVAEDQGQYRCQLDTEPPQVLTTTLHVIVPIARVIDGRGGLVHDQHYQSGSRIELSCVIEKVPFPHAPVTWRRGSNTLTYNTSRGGISVRGDRDAGFIRSKLYVADASPSDSGLYTCCYQTHTCDSVAVHVLAGENSAAMQHDANDEDDGGGGGDISSNAPPQHFPININIFAFISLTCHILLCTVGCYVPAAMYHCFGLT